MGTNYYVKKNLCDSCKRSDPIHLGKSSAGWKFLLQANGFEHYKNWKEMKAWLADKVIENEYEERVSVENFVDLVEKKHADPELWDHHTARPDQNILDDFAKQDPEGYDFHDGEFC